MRTIWICRQHRSHIHTTFMRWRYNIIVIIISFVSLRLLTTSCVCIHMCLRYCDGRCRWCGIGPWHTSTPTQYSFVMERTHTINGKWMEYFLKNVHSLVQKCNLNSINQNHLSLFAVYHVKKVKRKNMWRVKAVAGIVSTVQHIR